MMVINDVYLYAIQVYAILIKYDPQNVYVILSTECYVCFCCYLIISIHVVKFSCSIMLHILHGVFAYRLAKRRRLLLHLIDIILTDHMWSNMS